MISTADLATAELCAKGPKQLALVRELAAGPVVIRQELLGRGIRVLKYGVTQLDHRSFVGLRNRLKEAGFRFVGKPNDIIFIPKTIEMYV